MCHVAMCERLRSGELPKMLSVHRAEFSIRFLEYSVYVPIFRTRQCSASKHSNDTVSPAGLLMQALIVAWLSTNSVLADEPLDSKWDYAPKLLRPFWEGDTVEGESMLFIKDSKTGTSKASVLFPI